MRTRQPTQTETVPVAAFWFGSWRLTLDRRALTGEILRALYEKSAERWSDVIRRLDYPNAYRICFQHVPELNGVLESGGVPKVLDCGIGAGDLSLALAELSDRPIQLDGIDVSPNMLSKARQRLEAAEVDATLIEGDARRLPYGDNGFDIVMCAHLLEHFSDPSAALYEMQRVAKPGGLVVVCLTKRSLFGFFIHLKWRAQMLTARSAVELLQSVGFEDVEMIPMTASRTFRRMSLAFKARKTKSPDEDAA